MNFDRIPKLSDRLKHIRASFDLSQVELGDMVGTTQQAIQQAEMGKARQPRYLHKLAQVLEIPVDWVIFGEAVSDDSKNKRVATNVLNDKSMDVLDSFYAMPKKDQELLYELMKSRQKK